MRPTMRAVTFMGVLLMAAACSDDTDVDTKLDKGTTGDKSMAGDKAMAGDKGKTGDKAMAGDKGKTADKAVAGDKAMAGDKSMAKCGGKELCNYTVNEKCATMTLAKCLEFYDPAKTNCKTGGLTGYTTCNCLCLPKTPGQCAAYFACGTTCFNTHCK